MTIRAQVEEFHRACALPVLPRPEQPPADRVQLRARLVIEEAFELLEALGLNRIVLGQARATVDAALGLPPLPADLAAVADACADLDYVVEGTRLEFGIDGEPVAALVHAANMAKAGGPVREDGKRLKPPGWQPPDVAGEIARQRDAVATEENARQRYIVADEIPTRDRLTADGSREWSRRVEAYDDTDTPHRLRLVAEGGAYAGLISMSIVRVTSRTESAEPVASYNMPELILTWDDARWLLRHLPRAIEEAERHRTAEQPGG